MKEQNGGKRGYGDERKITEEIIIIIY